MRSSVSAVATAVVLALTAAAGAALPPAPVAKRIPVTDTYFGTSVVDPYRWMEANGPDLRAYLQAQNDRTRGALDALPGRGALEARLRGLADTNAAASSVTLRHGDVFYLKTPAHTNIAKLYVRSGATERLLLDPETLSEPHQAIAYFYPSNDAKRVAVGLAPGGSENASVRVVDVASATLLPDTSDRADFGVTSWSDDGNAFYYFKRQAPNPRAPITEKYLSIRAYRHVVGQPGTTDVAVFGIGVDHAVRIPPTSYAGVVVAPQSPVATGIVENGVDRFMTVYIAPKSQLDRPASVRWRLAIGLDDKVTDVAIHGTTVYALTAKGSPRFRVVRFEVGQTFAQAREVVPASDRVIDAIESASDALYVQSREDGRSRMTKVGYDNSRVDIPLPVDGTMSGLTTEYDRPGFWGELESWTTPPRWYSYDPATNAVTDAQLNTPSSVDFSKIAVEEVKVPAADGTLIPLSILHPRGLRLDGSNPTILWGYGAYGIPIDAGFTPMRMAFLERGGVFAYAHVRGGGEYGEAWHFAGKDANKATSIMDYIDCAKWLIAKGYTSPAKLAARGGSAGGIVIGGAFERAPQLFSAVVDEAPITDQLRMESTPNGPMNVPEFGSVKTPQGFKNLYATSPVHHVVKGTAYPAVLLTTGINDARVEPWQPAKFTAALQDATSSDKPIFLRVDFEGGHNNIGGTRAESVALNADVYSFILWQLGDPAFQP
jgi:prolyl oligopeptidase